MVTNVALQSIPEENAPDSPADYGENLISPIMKGMLWWHNHIVIKETILSTLLSLTDCV